MDTDRLTPMLSQYRQIKERFPDAIVLFRLGDFFETFEDDARIAASELEKVYRDVITPIRLAELLILREDLPRSLHFCMRQVSDTLDLVRNDRSQECLRLGGQVLSRLRYGRIQDILAQGLHEYLTAYLDSMQQLSVEVQRSFFAPTLPE